MRKSWRVPAVLVLLLLLLSASASTVFAKHTSSPGPLDAYPCQNEQWNVYHSYNPFFYHPTNGVEYQLGSQLWVLIDPDRQNPHGYNLYCGQVRSQSWDILDDGCVTFGGYVWDFSGSLEGSDYSEYHCTLKEYDIWGPVWYLSCVSGSTLEAVTYADPWADAWDSPHYIC